MSHTAVGSTCIHDEAPRFLSQIEIQRGPRDLLARTFLLMDKVLADRGVTLEPGSLDDLYHINCINRDSWLPLTPTFNPVYTRLDPSQYFCFLGRNASGEVVTTQAARLFDWRRSSFKAEAEALRLFYQEPDRHRRVGESLLVSAPSADSIRGMVMYTGAMWYRPDVRRLGLGYYMGRLSRAYALSQWDLSFVATMVSGTNVGNGSARRFGHTNLEFGAHSRGSSHGNVDYHIGWSDSASAMTGLAEFLAAEYSATSIDRRAQEA